MNQQIILPRTVSSKSFVCLNGTYAKNAKGTLTVYLKPAFRHGYHGLSIKALQAIQTISKTTDEKLTQKILNSAKDYKEPVHLFLSLKFLFEKILLPQRQGFAAREPSRQQPFVTLFIRHFPKNFDSIFV